MALSATIKRAFLDRFLPLLWLLLLTELPLKCLLRVLPLKCSTTGGANIGTSLQTTWGSILISLDLLMLLFSFSLHSDFFPEESLISCTYIWALDNGWSQHRNI